MVLSQQKTEKPQNNSLHTLISSYQWDEASAVLEKNPNLSSQRGELGELPLHMSLRRGAPESLILLLIESYSESVHLTGLNDQSLPLHLATIYSHTEKVITTLIRIYPEALDEKDEDGDTPRNCIRKNLDESAKDAIMKPTFYWTMLVNKFRKETEETIGTDLFAKIADLEAQIQEEKKRGQQKILELEKQLKEKNEDEV